MDVKHHVYLFISTRKGRTAPTAWMNSAWKTPHETGATIGYKHTACCLIGAKPTWWQRAEGKQTRLQIARSYCWRLESSKHTQLRCRQSRDNYLGKQCSFSQSKLRKDRCERCDDDTACNKRTRGPSTLRFISVIFLNAAQISDRERWLVSKNILHLW